MIHDEQSFNATETTFSRCITYCLISEKNLNLLLTSERFKSMTPRTESIFEHCVFSLLDTVFSTKVQRGSLKLEGHQLCLIAEKKAFLLTIDFECDENFV